MSVQVHELQLTGPLTPNHPKALTQLYHFDNQPYTTVKAMPRISVLAKIQVHSCILTNYSVMAPSRSTASPAATFNKWLNLLPPAEQRLVHFFAKLQENSLKQMSKIINNTNTILETGSDGGKIETGGSFAWLVLTNDLTPMWWCAGPVDGWE